MQPLRLGDLLRLAAAYYTWRNEAFAWLIAHERAEHQRSEAA
jgi:hypothetical protein